MFTLHFEIKKPPRQIKSLMKQFKKRNTIHDIEEFIKELQKNIDSDIELVIKANEVNGDLELTFDPMTIASDGMYINLLSRLISELQESGMDEEDIKDLTKRLEKQYSEEEKFIHDTQSTTENQPKQNKSFVGGLKQLFSKKNNSTDKEEVITSEQLANDFAELDEGTDEEQATHVSEEYEEHNEEELLVTDSYENTVNDDMNEEENEEIDYHDTNDDFDDPDVDMFSNVFEEESQDNNTWNESSVSATQVPEIPQKKNEKVTFPDIDSYTDLSKLESTIERHRRNISEEELLKLLNLPVATTVDDLTALDKKKINFARNQLNRTEIQEELQAFYNNIDKLVEHTQLNLTERHDDTLLKDYEKEASDTLDYELEEIRETASSELEEIESSANEKYNLKVDGFKAKQEKELEAFKQEQALELDNFMQEAEEKRNADVDITEQEKKKKLEEKLDDLIDEEMYRQKEKANSELYSFKRELISTFDTNLSDGAKKNNERLSTELAKIREEIERKETEWKEQIDREEALKQKQERIELERQRIRAMEEDVKVRNRELNGEEVIKHSPEYKKIMNLEEKLEQLLDSNNTYSANKENLELMNESQTPVMQNPNSVKEEQEIEKLNDKKEKDKKKLFGLTLLSGLILAVGTGWAVGRTNTVEQAPGLNETEVIQQTENASRNNAVHADSNQSETEELTNETLEDDRVTSLESQMEVLLETIDEANQNTQYSDETEENIEEEKTLNELLEAGDYEEAINKADSHGDYELIAEYMSQHEAIKDLKEFNEMYRTTYGKIFEAILRNDASEVAVLVENMEEDTLAKLSAEHKDTIALLLFQGNRNELANHVLSATIDIEK